MLHAGVKLKGLLGCGTLRNPRLQDSNQKLREEELKFLNRQMFVF